MRNSLGKNQRRARKVVEELDRRAEQEPLDAKRAAAQQRAAKERVERVKAALKQLKTMEAEASASERAKLRVSESEPEARKMKHADGSFALSYNVPVTTEAQSRMIVAIGVSTASNDTAELLPALARVEENCGQLPEQVIADNGYATRALRILRYTEGDLSGLQNLLSSRTGRSYISERNSPGHARAK